MKFTETTFEALVLRGLFAACLLVSGMILTAMVTTKPAPVQLASGGPVKTLLAAAPSTCALPDIGSVVCFHAES
ncbi:hypothetical protein [Dyella mobilis]|uniref:Uncharacterized protein n=1 Tax=Dyella mobilis TaxID=1849582 RepID=A0ABS2KAF2_9GAMM|nr:hypothetical protein [Dyella mobilis]MBM7128163.1 hypothetical protein [Dyella mobilis]GLQ99980.1 hypothetical protein GCM10007863_44000 [Dyella mobilis]